MSDDPGHVRAGCYLRISSDPNDKREGVDRQRADTTALCEVKGWAVAGFYTDNDRSASSGADRPEWDRLLADIAAGKIDAIAAWDQDRGWRMMHELEALRRFFATLGRPVRLATTGQGDIDLNSPTGVMMAQIKTAVSEHEIAMMKVRMRRAAKDRAERGIPKWRNAFGYVTDGSHQVDPVTGPLVADAYRTVLAGGSITDIARDWNERGFCGLTGRPWSHTTLSLFLRKPRNAGLRTHRGEVVGPGTWPALVDEQTWRAALAVLNAPGRGPGVKTVRRHLLTGVLRCGVPGCGGYMSGQWVMQPTGGKSGRPKVGETKPPKEQTAHRISYACKKCRGSSIRSDLVMPLVYGAVIGRLAREDAVDLLRAELHDESEAQGIRDELTRLYGELDSLAVERAQGLLTARQVKISTDIIEQQIEQWERKQLDGERLRVFDGLPLGTPEVDEAVRALTPDRLRAVIDILVEFTVVPVGRSGGKMFNPERVRVDWK